MSENLQLDRALASPGDTNGATVALTNLAGILVRPMDWKALLHNPKPELDPLAAFIPADQHAVFFPSFQAMTDVIDEADANGTPVLQLFEPRSEDAGSRARYSRQLCLGLNDPRACSARRSWPARRSPARTRSCGSERMSRCCSKRRIFRCCGPRGRPANRRASRQSQAAAVKGDIEGVQYVGVVSPDRAISSYMASVSNVVFVTNSRKQLENLVRTAHGTIAALSSQDEYLFFRQRYARGDTNETASWC